MATPSQNSGLTNFKPTIWSKKLQKIFDNIVVFAKLVNTDWEGELKKAGNQVNVRTYGNVTISNYTRDSNISFQNLTAPMDSMTIAQQKYFAFSVDDLDAAQADIEVLEGYSGRAAIAIRDVVDTHLSSHYADVPSGNQLGTSTNPIQITKDNAYATVVKLGRMLDDSKVPSDGRNLVVDPAFKEALLLCDQFVRATAMGDKVVTNGHVGNVNGMEVHVTTNLTTVNNGKPVMAFTKDFISFASQVNKVEHVRPYDMFADAIKGLYLYDSHVFTNHANCAALVWVDA